MKPVLFIDFDGTLCHDRFWRSTSLEVNRKIQEYLFGPDNRIVNMWMRGGHTAEEVNSMLSRELELDYEKLWSVFVRDCETMFIEKEMLEKIGRLRKRYITVLATDNMDCFDRFTVPALGLEQYFDEIVNSCQKGIFKTEGSGHLLKSVVGKYGVEIANSILVDNSRSACELFEEIGGRSLFVTKEKPLAYWLDTLTIDSTQGRLV